MIFYHHKPELDRILLIFLLEKGLSDMFFFASLADLQYQCLGKHKQKISTIQYDKKEETAIVSLLTL